MGQWFAGTGLARMRRLFLLIALVATAAFGGVDTVDKRVVLRGMISEAQPTSFQPAHAASSMTPRRASQPSRYSAASCGK